MDRGKKILVLAAVCSAVALLSWGFSLIYSFTHRSGKGSNTITEEVRSTSQTAATQERNNDFYQHGLIETDDFTIKLTGYKIINPGETGNEEGTMPAIGFWYDVTNKSGREISANNAWVYCISAVQDNDDDRVNELVAGGQPDSRYLETQSEKIKQGKTVSSAVSYILSDRETPVTLIATNGILGEDLGERTFELQGMLSTQTEATTQPGGITQPGATTQSGVTTQAGATSQTGQTSTGASTTTSTTSVPSLADPDTQSP